MSICKSSTVLLKSAKKSFQSLFKQSSRLQQHFAPKHQCAVRASSIWPRVPQGSDLGLQIVKQTRAKLSSAALALDPIEADEIITVCRPCASHDREMMINFMNQIFISREPLVRSLGATPKNSRKYVSYCVDEALDHQASFVAVDGNTGDICGLRLNTIGPSSGQELKIDFGSNVNAVPQFLHYIENGIDQLLGTEKYMRHVAICVQESASQCGIATDLMRLSVQHAKKEELRFITAMCSWKLPLKLATKMGYQVVRQLSYAEYAKSQTHLSPQQQSGLLALAQLEGEARVMIKKLR